MHPTLNPAQPHKPLASHLPLVPYPAWTHHHPPCGPAGSSFPDASFPQSIQLSQSHPQLGPGCPLSSETPKKPFPVGLAHTKLAFVPSPEKAEKTMWVSHSHRLEFPAVRLPGKQRVGLQPVRPPSWQHPTPRTLQAGNLGWGSRC